MIVHRFLLVSLGIETILGETTIRRRREKLKQMSTGQDVGDVYTATLERIRGQGGDRARLGMEAIMWIAYSRLPLSPDELCQALGVAIGSTDLDNDNIPSIRTILNCGLGLITVDSSSSRVRLVHFTLQEHILANPTLFCSPHSIIAEVCLTYLNFRCIMDPSPASRPLPPTTPFLEYASRYWAAHARRQTSVGVVSLALNLFDRYDAHLSSEIHLPRQFLKPEHWGFDGFDGPTKFTVLHAGAFFGVSEIMVSLLNINKWDLNATDSFGSTALMWAARMEHDAIVQMLLEREGVDPNIVDHLGRTPLSLAAKNGNRGIVEMLLVQGGVSPDGADKCGRTPLSWAAGPECWGANTEERYKRVVKMLLERNEVNPDTVDKCGRTPLSRAAESGHGEIVLMLLERNDVNPEAKDGDGRTPLSRAVTPWMQSWESKDPCIRVVKILLERNDVNPNSADKSGRTPFSWAAGGGCGGIVDLLLKRGNVDPNRPDESGRTPLSWAAKNGHEKIVGMLSQRNDAHPDTVDENGQTPFLKPTENNRAKAVHGQAESHDPLMIGLGGGLFGPFVSGPSSLPEPPPKRIRRF